MLLQGQSISCKYTQFDINKFNLLQKTRFVTKKLDIIANKFCFVINKFNLSEINFICCKKLDFLTKNQLLLQTNFIRNK